MLTQCSPCIQKFLNLSTASREIKQETNNEKFRFLLVVSQLILFTHQKAIGDQPVGVLPTRWEDGKMGKWGNGGDDYGYKVLPVFDSKINIRFKSSCSCRRSPGRKSIFPGTCTLISTDELSQLTRIKVSLPKGSTTLTSTARLM